MGAQIDETTQGGRRFRNRILTRRSFDTVVAWCRTRKGGYHRRSLRLVATFLQLKRAFPALPVELANEALEEHRSLISKGTGPFLLYDIVDDIIENYFPHGWGRRFINGRVHNLPNRSVAGGGTTRDPDGSAGVYPSIVGSSFHPLAEHFAQKEFDRCYQEATGGDLDFYRVEAVAVPDAGKFRVITKSARSLKVLQPLQAALHKHLCRFPEFEFTGKSVDEFPRRLLSGRGRFLSVDYRSATDSVNGTFMSSLISRIIDRSDNRDFEALRKIAETELGMGREIAYATLGTVKQSRGSLMGSLLSFPLLCLWNASIIRRAVHHTNFVVNGDDALVRCQANEKLAWEHLSRELGVAPSPGKVYWSDRLITFCSVYWTVDGNRVRKIDTVPVSLMNSELDGDLFNKVPDRYAPQYKRWCKYRACEWRSLLGPRAYGGLGGHPRPNYPLKPSDRSCLLKASSALEEKCYPLWVSRFFERHNLQKNSDAPLSWLRPAKAFEPLPRGRPPRHPKRMSELPRASGTTLKNVSWLP